MLCISISLLNNVAALSGGGGGTAPVLSAPTGTKTAATTATLGGTTDTGSGTLYWVVTTSSTAPSAAQVKAGQDNGGAAAMAHGSQAVSATGAQSVSATGLTAANAPYGFLMHESAGGQSNVIATGALLGAEIVVNGSFSAGTNWTTGGDATISGGTANFANAGTGFELFQSNAGIVSGHTYRTVYTITAVSAGNVKCYLGSTGTTQGTARSAVGTYTEDLTPSSSNEIGFFITGFTGSCDNYSVKEIL